MMFKSILSRNFHLSLMTSKLRLIDDITSKQMEGDQFIPSNVTVGDKQTNRGADKKNKKNTVAGRKCIKTGN